MKRFTTGAIIGMGLLVGIGVIFRSQLFPQKEIHYHAGFKVFIDKELKDFSDIGYMSISPCDGTDVEQEEQSEKGHLHDGIGTVVHVHREGAVWGDLFKNLNYTFDEDKPLKAYLANGEEIANVLEYRIKAYESIVVLIGTVDDPKPFLDTAVTRSEIEIAEAKSENCGPTL